MRLTEVRKRSKAYIVISSITGSELPISQHWYLPERRCQLLCSGCNGYTASQVHLEVTRPMHSGEYGKIGMTANVSAMELVTIVEVEVWAMNFWARGLEKRSVLKLRSSQHREFVEKRSRDSGEVTKTGAGWGGHQWECWENQLLFLALRRKNFYAKGLPWEDSLHAK